jgi:hypothetical protein
MERNANESFAAYKVRRAAANLAVKNINRNAHNGGQSARAKLREFAPGFHAGIKGVASSNRTSMGAGIAAPQRLPLPTERAMNLLTSGIGWTNRHQGLMLAGVLASLVIGQQICRLTGAGEF